MEEEVYFGCNYCLLWTKPCVELGKAELMLRLEYTLTLILAHLLLL